MPGGTMWRFLADLLVLMERNFYLLRDSATSIFIAQDVRLSRISRKRELRSFSLLCASLLSRAEQRSRNLQDALDARLYNGELAVRRVHARRNPFRMVSIFTLIVVVVVAGCSR
jgi:energy-coupling factor transporter transmembrane protein EcfT